MENTRESRLQKIREQDNLGYNIVKRNDKSPYLVYNNTLYDKLTGKYIVGDAGEDFDEVRWKIAIVIISSLAIAIMSTISYNVYKDTTINPETNQTVKEIFVGILSISWFLFITFIFLLFGQGRLMYILFFMTIVALGLTSNSVIENQIFRGDNRNKKLHDMLISIVVISILASFILLYYWATTKRETEILELKTKEKVRKQNELFAKEIAEQSKLVKEATKNEYEEKIKTRDEIGTRAIDLLLQRGSKAGQQAPKGNKKKDGLKEDNE